MPFILGVEVKRDGRKRVLSLHQGYHMQQLLERHNLQDCNPNKLPFAPHLTDNRDDEPTLNPDPQTVTEFRGKTGSLIYAMRQTRLDISCPRNIG